MNSVSVQIQRAINDAISNQVLPLIQNVILAGSGPVTRKGWDVSAERPEINPEVQRNLNARNNLRNEQDEGHQNGDFPSYNVHDTVQFNFVRNVFCTKCPISFLYQLSVYEMSGFWLLYEMSFVRIAVVPF